MKAAAMRRGTALLLVAAALAAAAQTPPPAGAGAAVEMAPATTVAEFPAGTFLENIAVDGQGRLFVNSHLDGKIYRIAPGGERSLWASIDGTIAGLALNPDGSAIVSGWIGGKLPAVFSVAANGSTAVLLRLPGGQFPNGVLRMGAGRFLVADSYRGVIWLIDTASRSASIWLDDPLLSRADAKNPTPAVNGIKLFDGAVYASNTARQLLLRIPLVNGAAGAPQTLLQHIGLDDFAFDDQGTLYGATHVGNSLVSVTRQGKVTVIAGLAQGMAGSTAVAAVPADGGRWQLFVVTNGGLSLPPAGGVQPARVVRVDLRKQP